MPRIIEVEHEHTPLYERDLGNGTTSYLAVLLLTAVVVAAAVSTGFGGALASAFRTGICIIGGSDCQSVDGTRLSGTQPSGTLMAAPINFLSAAERRAVTNWLNQRGVKLKYEAGGGNAYDPATRTLHLNTNTPQGQQEKAITIVAYRIAQIPRPPSLAHPGDMSRNEYVEKNIDRTTSESADFLVKSLLFRRQLEALSPEELNAIYPHRKIFDDAYEAGGVHAAHQELEKAMRPYIVQRLQSNWDNAHKQGQWWETNTNDKDWSCAWIFC
jgi:hypothetical protein